MKPYLVVETWEHLKFGNIIDMFEVRGQFDTEEQARKYMEKAVELVPGTVCKVYALLD